MPMRRSLFLLLLVPTLAWGKVYYASPSGSGAACSKAVPCALVTGAAKPGAGDTLYLRGGTYSDGIKTATSAIRSGTSWDNPVIIASAPGETAVIRGSIDLNGYHTNLVPGVAYVQFKGLVLDGGAISILKDNIHHLRFQNMEVKNVRQAGPACSLGGPEVCPGRSAIYGGAGAHHIEFSGMSVHDNGLNQLDHGFYVTLPDGVIENSEVYNNAGYGIQIYDSACKGYPVEACANRMVIRGNRIHDNAGDGGVTLNHGNDILFQDNVVANNAGGGLRGINYGNPQNTQVLNNTFTGNRGAAIEIGAFGVTGTQLRNNLLENNAGGIVNNSGSTVQTGNVTSAAPGAGAQPGVSRPSSPPPGQRK